MAFTKASGFLLSLIQAVGIFLGIRCMAPWWKTVSLWRLFFARFQDSQPQRRALRGPAKVFKSVYKVYVFFVGQEEVFGEDVVVKDLFCLLEAGGKKHGFRF